MIATEEATSPGMPAWSAGPSLARRATGSRPADMRAATQRWYGPKPTKGEATLSLRTSVGCRDRWLKLGALLMGNCGPRRSGREIAGARPPRWAKAIPGAPPKAPSTRAALARRKGHPHISTCAAFVSRAPAPVIKVATHGNRFDLPRVRARRRARRMGVDIAAQPRD